jgi:regulator of protease activity HflC (stomatin/prohibitin superfamily)
MLTTLASSFLPLALLIVIIILVWKGVRIVPQQHAFVVERLGKYAGTLDPGLHVINPLFTRVAYKHDLREIPLEVPPQVCITKDNTQLQVDGILYFQVTDAKLASYGSSNFELAITQLAQTTLRSVIGKLELDKTFEERASINGHVVSALDEAALNWGVKVLRYEIKDLTPPETILRSMQAQITAEREKRALIAASEGRRQEQINIATGQREASIAKSDANAEAIRKIAAAIETQGGMAAMNLKVAEQYVSAFANLAKQGNTLIIPSNVADIASLIQTATTIVKRDTK